MFDIESRNLDKDFEYYENCVKAIFQNSPSAKIFCLVHKMDLIPEDKQETIFKEREVNCLHKISCRHTCTQNYLFLRAAHIFVLGSYNFSVSGYACFMLQDFYLGRDPL